MERALRERQQHASASHYIGRPTSDTALDQLVRLTSRLFRFPMVQVNLLDTDTQHTVAARGIGSDSIPRMNSFCHQVVRDARPTMLADLEHVPEGSRHIRAYVGVPITGREGLVIGTLCIMDTVPRRFGMDQLRDLEDIAAVVRDQLELVRRLGPAPAGSIAGAAALVAAVESGEILPFYQPVVSLRSGKVRGFEALARWQHPQRGLVDPSGFVPLAEDSDLIIDLDLCVLRQAAIDLAGWQKLTPELRLNVNLSARHFDHSDCVDRLTGAVLEAGVAPQSVSFEVTETAALAAHPGEYSYLVDLREQGFQVVLDDFGIGFSSMEQVMRLPIDGIKLDRTITAAMGSRVGDAVVRALLGLASDLGLDSVIEGVETREQADRARRSGCAHGQGYLYAPAMPAEDIRNHLRRVG